MEIHHQEHTKVHHVLYPLYYWPGMDATIEAVCTSCAKCIRANRLNLDFNPASQRGRLLPRQRYGIDFYAVHNGEIHVMMHLFSRETMLEYIPNRKMEKVCQTIMKWRRCARQSKIEWQASSFDSMQINLTPTKHQPGLKLRVGKW